MVVLSVFTHVCHLHFVCKKSMNKTHHISELFTFFFGSYVEFRTHVGKIYTIYFWDLIIMHSNLLRMLWFCSFSLCFGSTSCLLNDLRIKHLFWIYNVKVDSWSNLIKTCSKLFPHTFISQEINMGAGQRFGRGSSHLKANGPQTWNPGWSWGALDPWLSLFN